MKKIFYILLLITLSTISREAIAQTDTLAVSFNEALNYATENAYMSKSAGYDIEAAKKTGVGIYGIRISTTESIRCAK